MKSKKRVITVVVLALAGVALIALPAAALRGRAGCGKGMGKGMGMGPTFTDEQLEQMKKIHGRYDDERAELTNRLKVLMLEGQEVVDADTPDFDAIENKIEEMAEVKVELAKLRLKIHKEIRPLLDDDQKVLFDRGLGRLLHGGKGGRGKGHPGMMGHGGMRGCMMGGCMMGGPGGKCGPDGKGGPGGGHPGMMGHGGMGGGMPEHAGMGGGDGHQKMPSCPFADTDPDTDPDE